jgi:hypothetical protein
MLQNGSLSYTITSIFYLNAEFDLSKGINDEKAKDTLRNSNLRITALEKHEATTNNFSLR